MKNGIFDLLDLFRTKKTLLLEGKAEELLLLAEDRYLRVGE